MLERKFSSLTIKLCWCHILSLFSPLLLSANPNKKLHEYSFFLPHTCTQVLYTLALHAVSSAALPLKLKLERDKMMDGFRYVVLNDKGWIQYNKYKHANCQPFHLSKV
jgi:hypothetical protein